jgi:ribosome modulation factor
MSAEERMVASEKGYENGIGAMSAEERMSARDKGYENGIGAMSAEERMAKAAKWTVEIDGSMMAFPSPKLHRNWAMAYQKMTSQTGGINI